ncbi:hypothetical protein JVT61DRAFT_14854 [Boletus reticuloceps]|uniref:Uncharacterized protein n=1 Tax=Boletus reticuloceps TaxID=495285 RepID=A0A8I2YCL8_9AGAM|nr:hypothetical protein JVT61DRAFT_14854 [Boletus reticuloceps]
MDIDSAGTVSHMWSLQRLGTAICKKLLQTNNNACKMQNLTMLFHPLTIGQGVQPLAGAIAFYPYKREHVNSVRHRSLINEADKENLRYILFQLGETLLFLTQTPPSKTIIHFVPL